MRKIVAAAFLMVALLFGGPWLMVKDAEPEETEKPARLSADAEQTKDTPKAQSKTQKKTAKTTADEQVTLRVWNGKKTVEMTMAEYLPGVVRGEMPASFEPEALAAQAVAERTYIYYQMAGGRKDNHPDADICMDHTCCNAWVSEKQARKNWGKNADAYEKKIRQAVQSTDGKVMLYDGAPILAVFHSSSAGVTAGSGDVWVSDLPYLTSVKSPETADNVPNYYSVNTFSADEFRTAFLASHPEAELSGSPENWIGGISRSGSDRVETAEIGGVSVSGTELREIFSLRSTCFTVEVSGGEITFHVTGYGHGVGMSQYGANELASEGKSWQDILHWYYTDVTIADYAG
ncbi:MAG: stage II sporulation protein D [Clostridiales bacterium]|nr:stage II sporulation protein D [Candidatus Cacconaster stercorequi]